MAFINQSVGRSGVNKAEDVKVVQWLLDQNEIGYHFMSSLSQGSVDINGTMDASTQIALDDWAQFCDGKGLLPNRMTVYRGVKLEPNNDYYKRLIFGIVLKSSSKVFANDNNNYQDPRVKQAIDGRINFEQFKFIVEQARGKVLTPLGREMQKLLANDQRVQAFLEVIAFAEGTDRDKDPALSGYSTTMGYGTAPDLYNHPGKKAAGRYQAIPATWSIAEKALGLYDFTPESQEIFGAWDLVKNKSGIYTALKNNDFPAAVEAASSEWASFPNRALTGNDPETNPTSRYKYSSGLRKGQNQPAPYKLSELKKIYDDQWCIVKETTPVWK